MENKIEEYFLSLTLFCLKESETYQNKNYLTNVVKKFFLENVKKLAPIEIDSFLSETRESIRKERTNSKEENIFVLTWYICKYYQIDENVGKLMFQNSYAILQMKKNKPIKKERS